MESCCATNPAPLQMPVTLSDLTTITGTLVTLLRKAYGPKGQMMLLVSSTGQASMVKNGLEILSSLHLSHPVAKVVLQASKNLVASYGDGCKTMILYTNALISALKKGTEKQTLSTGSNTGTLQNEMVKTLDMFCKQTLPVLLSKTEDFLNSKMDEALKTKDISWILFHVISTYLNGCIPHQAVHLIAELVVHYLSDGCCSLHDYTESVKWLSSCVFTCQNKPYSSSCLKSGVFLHHPLQKVNNKTSSTNMVCLMCPLVGAPSKHDGKDMCQISDPDVILQHQHKVTQKFLSVMQDKHVGLIICSSNIPSYALHMCQIYDIAVIHSVEESDIDFLCYLTGKSPVTSCFEDVPSCCVMKVSSFNQIVDGSFIYSNILFEDDLEWKPRSIFLCAPSEALAKQLKQAVEKCLVVVSHLLKGSYHGQPDFHVLKNVACGGGYFELVLSKFLTDHFNENSSFKQIWCCDVLKEMLIAPVCILYDNLSCQENKKHGFFNCSKLMRARINCENSPCGLIEKCLDSGIIDILSTKIAILYSALSLALRLINVESILSVSKPCSPQ